MKNTYKYRTLYQICGVYKQDPNTKKYRPFEYDLNSGQIDFSLNGDLLTHYNKIPKDKIIKEYYQVLEKVSQDPDLLRLQLRRGTATCKVDKDGEVEYWISGEDVIINYEDGCLTLEDKVV